MTGRFSWVRFFLGHKRVGRLQVLSLVPWATHLSFRPTLDLRGELPLIHPSHLNGILRIDPWRSIRYFPWACTTDGVSPKPFPLICFQRWWSEKSSSWLNAFFITRSSSHFLFLYFILLNFGQFLKVKPSLISCKPWFSVFNLLGSNLFGWEWCSGQAAHNRCLIYIYQW